MQICETYQKAKAKKKIIHDEERNRNLNWNRKVFEEKNLPIHSSFSTLRPTKWVSLFYDYFAGKFQRFSVKIKFYDRIIYVSVLNEGKVSDWIIDLLYFLLQPWQPKVSDFSVFCQTRQLHTFLLIFSFAKKNFWKTFQIETLQRIGLKR